MGSARTATTRSAPGADRDRLIGLVRAFAGRRVAVLGDFVADEFVYGDIARISREAPVPILTHRKTVVTPGGGGNAVANLRALGAQPLPIGVVGRDEAGRRLLDAFKQGGITRRGIRVEVGYGTPCKSRILAGGVHTRRQQIVRVDRGGGDGHTRTVRLALRRTLRQMLPELPVVRRGGVVLLPVEPLRTWLREQAGVEGRRADAIAGEVVAAIREERTR